MDEDDEEEDEAGVGVEGAELAGVDCAELVEEEDDTDAPRAAEAEGEEGGGRFRLRVPFPSAFFLLVPTLSLLSARILRI